MATLTLSKLPSKMTKDVISKLANSFSGKIVSLDMQGGYSQVVVRVTIEVPDDKAASFAGRIREKYGKSAVIKGIPEQTPATAPRQAAAAAPPLPLPDLTERKSPYRFLPRPWDDNRRRPVESFHDELKTNNYDIAFEVTWRSETPIAANPCSSGGEDRWPLNAGEGKYQGFNKRWLMVDNHLAISPFTVKSAIANGFAALMGSCYRVTKRSEGHPQNPDPDNVNYNGAYKRYRVDMSNSNPGILTSISNATGDVHIEKVIEYYYDSPTPPTGVTFTPGATYYCLADHKRSRWIIQPGSIRSATGSKRTEEHQVVYYGEYTFGMNLTLGPGQFNKNHHHRFYKSDGVIAGKVSKINLKDLMEQKKKVYMGTFRKLAPAYIDCRPDPTDPTRAQRFCDANNMWYQDLTALGQNDWIYYQEFNGRVAAIGLNFQFKTTFEHSDAVPEDQQECKDMRCLCPRCSLFGMAGETSRDDRDAVGFKGRFKASALVNEDIKIADEITGIEGTIPFNGGTEAVLYCAAGAENAPEPVARQLLMPIMGGAKPSKRDNKRNERNIENVKRYYENGMIRGAKEYIHSGHTMATFTMFIEDRVNRWRTLSDAYGRDCPPVLQNTPYNHDLRNYAVLCREKLNFTGTLGAENSSVAEIAALFMLLQTSYAEQGFKIGLGKSQGLGSVSSSIRKVWVRKKETYSWTPIEIRGRQAEILRTLENAVPGLTRELTALKDAQSALNQGGKGRDLLNDARRNRRLVYPAPGEKSRDYPGYWEEFAAYQE